VIWRPYLLTQEILSYVDPEVAQEYREIRKWFVDNHLGILDESNDYYNYLNIVDACISENGACSFELIQRMRIPTLILNEDVDYDFIKEHDYRIRLSDVYYEDKRIWFLAEPFGLICEMDLISGEFHNLTSIQDEDSAQSIYGRYGGIVKVNSKLILSPHYAKDIIIYDYENQQQGAFDFEPSKVKLMNFEKVILYNKFVFLIPKQFESIVRFDTETETWTYCDRYIDEVKNRTAFIDNSIFFILGYEREGNLLRLFSSVDDIDLEFDMSTEKFEIKKIGVDGYKTFSSLNCGDRTFLYPYLGNKIVIWNKILNNCMTVENEETDYLANGIIKYAPFCGGAYYQNKVLCFPNNKHPILSLSLEGEILDSAEEGVFQSSNPLNEEPNQLMDINFYFAKQISQTGFITFRVYDNTFFWAMDQNSEIHKTKCALPQMEIEKVIVRKISDILYVQEMRIQETQELPLGSFLLFIASLGKAEKVAIS
jgi:hypothetical protein